MFIYTDSRSFYNNLVLFNTITEKRLLIDLYLLYQAYEKREIAEVRWIPTVLRHGGGDYGSICMGIYSH